MAEIKTFGPVDERSRKQLETCMKAGDAAFGVLCADHHPGYSQPIGGAIAYEGYVSPSGVGYDIGCIAAGTRVATEDGWNAPIEEIRADDPVLGSEDGSLRRVYPCEGALARGRQAVYRLQLEDGRSLAATADHEFRTKLGWRRLDQITAGLAIACSPFVGLPYEPCTGEIALPDLRHRDELARRGLLPVPVDGPRFPALVRLLVYTAGDGHLSTDGKRVSLFTSVEPDANALAEDFGRLGFQPLINRRERGERVRTQYTVYVNSVALHELFAALGCPVGRKVAAWTRDPFPWLAGLPAWLRAHALSAIASAEATTPSIVAGRPANLAIKQAGKTRDAIDWIVRLTESLDFKVGLSLSGPARNGVQTWVMQVLGGADEQLRFLREVGFCRAVEKRRAAAAVLSVMSQRAVVLANRSAAIEAARTAKVAGAGTVRQIVADISSIHGVPASLVFHGLYGRGAPRSPKGLQLRPDVTGETAWLRVTGVERAEAAAVYDVVTGDPAQSFLANGVVAHNCGNKAVRTDMTRAELDGLGGVGKVMGEVARRVSFGIGVPAREKVDHVVLDQIEQAAFEPQRKLAGLARKQLGTVGSGNHYVNLFADEDDVVWVGVHFGSRGFGHKTASGFLALAQRLPFDDGERKRRGLRVTGNEMDSPPVLFAVDSELGQSYIEAMQLAGRYAYAGRDVVADRVLEILGARATHEVHNHHNFAWREQHHGRSYWVVRKGCTPADPGQEGFVGATMGDDSVILEGVESEDAALALRSTVHGAGRVMSRSQAKGKVRRGKVIRPGLVDWPAVQRRLREQGVVLVGGGPDEAPEVYKELRDVLAAHAGTIRVKHTLTPLGVAMAGADVFDPYKD